VNLSKKNKVRKKNTIVEEILELLSEEEDVSN